MASPIKQTVFHQPRPMSTAPMGKKPAGHPGIGYPFLSSNVAKLPENLAYVKEKALTPAARLPSPSWRINNNFVYNY
jgi:hypothetical protein